MRGAAERRGPQGPGGLHLAARGEVPRGGQDQGDDRTHLLRQEASQVHVEGQGRQDRPRSGRHVLGHAQGRRVW